MHRAIRLTLATLAGFVVGNGVNFGLVTLGGVVMPPPPGTDPSTIEGLKAAMPLFGPAHFLFPFLAHALGTLAGAAAATLLTPARTAGPAWAVGGLFLLGGCVAVWILPAPVWFSVLDLVLAYLPAAWLGHRLVAGSGRT